METLVVVHRNQCYNSSRSKPQVQPGFGSYCSSPSREFRAINCRTFQTGNGILPTPFKSYNHSPVTKTPSSSKTQSPPQNSNLDNKTRTPQSTPIPINGKSCKKETTFIEGVPDGAMLLSELWAGPTYSNSPPPSSLPIPKFSVRPKRTVSLDLPGSSLEIEMHPVAKSAPSSPHREYSPSMKDLFVNDDSATKTLCRILNLNLDDE